MWLNKDPTTPRKVTKAWLRELTEIEDVYILENLKDRDQDLDGE